MAISDQIVRIQKARDTIREKEKDMGIVNSAESPNLTLLAERLDGITVVDNLLHEIDGLDGQYILEPGYYKGGTISVKGSAGDYKLASLGTITPSTSAHVFDPSSYSVYGFSKFTVDKIPKNFGDITTLTTFTTSDKLLSNEQVIVKVTGADNQPEAVRVTGTMTNNGNTTATLTLTKKFYTIPEGYHAGGGQVSISLELEKTAILGTSESTIKPADGKLLSTVKIPSVSTFLTGKVTATAADVLPGKKFVDKDGNQVAGTMTDNGNVTIELTNTNKSYTVPTGYHAGGGQVNVAGDFIGSDITRQAAKTITPTKSTQPAVAANVYTTGAITVGAIPSEYQDITTLENNLDGIAANISFIGSDDRTKYGTAQLRSGAFEWDYRTSNTFTIPTGIYRDGENGSTSPMSWYENETSFQTWVQADRNTLPATDRDGQAFSRAYIVPCEGNGYITSMDGPYGIDTTQGGGDKYGVLFYNNTFYVVDRDGPSGGYERLYTNGYSYTMSAAYVTLNSLESALAAI